MEKHHEHDYCGENADENDGDHKDHDCDENGCPLCESVYKRRIPALGKAQLCRHLIIGIHVEAVIPTNHRLPKRILICNLDQQWVGFSSLTFPHLCSRVGLRFADENKKKSGKICSTDCTVKMEAMRVKRLG